MSANKCMLAAVGLTLWMTMPAKAESMARRKALQEGKIPMCHVIDGTFKNIPCVFLKSPGAQVAVIPKMDGRIFSYVETHKGLDQFYNDPTDGFCMMFGGMMMRLLTGEAAAHGDLTKPFREVYPQWHRATCRTVEADDRCTLVMEPPCELFKVQMTVTLLRDGQLQVRARATLDADENASLMLCFRPMTCAGGRANRSTVITIPSREGLRQYRYDPDVYLLETFPMGQDWIAASNAEAGETLLFRNVHNMTTAYFWSADTSYYPELYSGGVTLKPGESYEGGVDLRVIQAGAISSIQGGLAVGCHPAADILLQPRPIHVLFSAAALDGSAATGKVRVELRRAGADAALEAREIPYRIAADAEGVFAQTVAFETRDLPDGDYDIVPVFADPGLAALPAAQVRLAGSEAARIRQEVQALLPRLHARCGTLEAEVERGSVGAAVETLKLLGAMVRCGTANERLNDYQEARRNSRLGWHVANLHAQEAVRRTDAVEGRTTGMTTNDPLLAASASPGVPALFESIFKGTHVTNSVQPFWHGIPVEPDAELKDKIARGRQIDLADIHPPLKPFEHLRIVGVKELLAFDFASARVIRGGNVAADLMPVPHPDQPVDALLIAGVFTPDGLAAALAEAGIPVEIEAPAAGSLIDFHTLRGRRAGIICASSAEHFDQAWRLARSIRKTLASNSIWLGDLHTHTVESDGHCTPLRSILAAQRAFMDFQAISDHATVEGSRKGAEVLARLGINFPLVWAQEGVSTSDKATHMLFYGCRETMDINLDWPAMIRAAHAKGGLAVLAHPAPRSSAWQRTALADFPASGLDGLELSLAVQELLAQGWPPQGSIPALLSNSDSHDDAFIQPLRSVVFAPTCTETAIVDALRDRRAIAYTCGELYGDAELCDVFRAVCQEEIYWREAFEPRVVAAARQILALIKRIGKDGL